LLTPNKSWGLTGGFYVHPTRTMQALYFDGHAKATRFSQTLGSGDTDEQWAWTTARINDVNLARKGLQTDPQIQAVYGG
jgi:prepilin-type processing-associated H-X9-DG protein